MAAYLDPDEIYDLSSDLLPCEFCHEPFPMDLLIAHSTGCRPDLANYKQSEVDDTETKVSSYSAVKSSMVNRAPNLVTKPVLQPNPGNNRLEDEDYVKAMVDAVKATQKSHVQIPSSGKTYNLETKKPVQKESSPAATRIAANFFQTGNDLVSQNKAKSQQNSKPMLNNSVKLDSNIGKHVSSSELSNSIRNTFDEPDDEEMTLSSDDDDAVESIENFWKRAATILKKRLTEGFPSKPSLSCSQTDAKEKMAAQRNDFSYPRTRKPNQWRAA